MDLLDSEETIPFVHLEHPGELIYLQDQNNSGSDYKLYQPEMSFFDQILLRTNMIKAHLGKNYEKAFASALNSGNFFFAILSFLLLLIKYP